MLETTLQRPEECPPETRKTSKEVARLQGCSPPSGSQQIQQAESPPPHWFAPPPVPRRSRAVQQSRELDLGYGIFLCSTTWLSITNSSIHAGLTPAPQDPCSLVTASAWESLALSLLPQWAHPPRSRRHRASRNPTDPPRESYR